MREENYFFRLSAYATGCSSTTRPRPSAIEPEQRRNEVLSLIEGGLQDFSISRTTFDWGVPLPVGSRARHVRLVRRADELRHRRRVRERPRAVRADVAGEHPHDRQGHRAVPRRVLARDADGRGPRAADAGVGARLPARGRREDVEDEAHGHPPIRADRPFRRRLLPLLLHAGDLVRSGRRASRGSR